MLALAFAGGWIVNSVIGEPQPASAASFIEEADASYDASQARLRMDSQLESPLLDRREIASATGIDLPAIPAEWALQDVQVYPSDHGPAVALVMETTEGESVSMFATRAETPAEKLPLLEQRAGRSLAYWENGPFAYALAGEVESERVLSFASRLAAGS